MAGGKEDFSGFSGSQKNIADNFFKTGDKAKSDKIKDSLSKKTKDSIDKVSKYMSGDNAKDWVAKNKPKAEKGYK